MSVPERHTNLRHGAGGRAVHDIGGLAGLAAPIDRHEHELSLYEKRVDALVMLLGGPKRQCFKIDALRRVVESYAEQEYDQIPYYDRWMRAVRDLVIEQELISPAELRAQLAIVRRELEAQGRTVSHEAVPE